MVPQQGTQDLILRRERVMWTLSAMPTVSYVLQLRKLDSVLALPGPALLTLAGVGTRKR